MNKLEKLKENLSKYKSAVIAFSGGVDSTFLAKVASEVLGDNLLLVTVKASIIPNSEIEETKELAKTFRVKHQLIEFDITKTNTFIENLPNRCYFCKKDFFSLIKQVTYEKGFEVVFDGSNIDDNADYRPGKKALKELGVISPLAETEFTKEEIRNYSRIYNLSTAEKPAYACLASRFPYGEKITVDKLERVEKSEQRIRNLGFIHFRVRSHDNLARIEFAPGEIAKGWEKRNDIEKICIEAGYNYVAIDIRGYRTGAMNETLNT